MTPSPRTHARRVTLLLSLLPCLAGPLRAQAGDSPGILWEMTSPRAGWCLHFLMEPEEAAKDLAKGSRPRPVGGGDEVPEALRRVAQEDAQYADWVPAQLCTYVAEEIHTGKRRFNRGDGGRALAVVYWAVAAAGEGEGAGEAVSFRFFGTNSSGLRRAMEIENLPMEQVEFSVEEVAESEDLQYRLKLEGATITFDGRPSPDSTLTASADSVAGSMRGRGTSVWKVGLALNPATLEAFPGALRIVGKRGLAKALVRSPIRLVGPVLSGGMGLVRFRR